MPEKSIENCYTVISAPCFKPSWFPWIFPYQLWTLWLIPLTEAETEILSICPNTFKWILLLILQKEGMDVCLKYWTITCSLSPKTTQMKIFKNYDSTLTNHMASSSLSTDFSTWCKVLIQVVIAYCPAKRENLRQFLIYNNTDSELKMTWTPFHGQDGVFDHLS